MKLRPAADGMPRDFDTALEAAGLTQEPAPGGRYVLGNGIPLVHIGLAGEALIVEWASKPLESLLRYLLATVTPASAVGKGPDQNPLPERANFLILQLLAEDAGCGLRSLANGSEVEFSHLALGPGYFVRMTAPPGSQDEYTVAFSRPEIESALQVILELQDAPGTPATAQVVGTSGSAPHDPELRKSGEGIQVRIPGGQDRLLRGPAFTPIELHDVFMQRLDWAVLEDADPVQLARLEGLIAGGELNYYGSLLFGHALEEDGIPFLPEGPDLVSAGMGYRIRVCWPRAHRSVPPYVAPFWPPLHLVAIVLDSNLALASAHVVSPEAVNRLAREERIAGSGRSERRVQADLLRGQAEIEDWTPAIRLAQDNLLEGWTRLAVGPESPPVIWKKCLK